MWEAIKKFFGADVVKTIEEALSEDQAKEMKEKLGEAGKIVITDGKSWIPKSRLDEVISERDKLKNQIDEKDKQIEATKKTLTELKKAAEGDEDLSSKLETAETTITKLQADHAVELRLIQEDTAIEKVLVDAKVLHPELLVGKFDRTKFARSEDGKTITGIKDQLETMREPYKDLFPDGKPAGDEPPGGTITPTSVSQLRKDYDVASKAGKTHQMVRLKRLIKEAEDKAKNK